MILGVGAAVARWRSGPEAGTMKIQGGTGHFQTEGFTLLVPPIRLPGRASGRNRTEIWVKIPSNKLLDVSFDEQGRFDVAFPVGSHLARVESEKRKSGDWWVADVRATRLGSEGQWFQVFRPASAKLETELWGIEWLRGDTEAQREADDWVAQIAGAIHGPEERAKRASRKARINNACADCHRLKRADAKVRREFGPVHRGTDASGFFVPATLLRDEAPLEDYAPREMNWEVPHVQVKCAHGTPVLVGKEPLQSVRCPGGAVATARLDLKAALASGDPHAQEICRGRLFLLEHMEADDRARFSLQENQCANFIQNGETPSEVAP